MKEDDDFIRLTEDIYNSHNFNSNENLIKSDLFSLLDGTRALEIGNSILDTGLVKFTKDELSFNTTKILKIDSIMSIMNKLIRSLISWIDGNFLAVSVLSCRYVLTLLINYLKNKLNTDISLIEKCSFYDFRFHSVETDDHNYKSSFDYTLLHYLLKIFIIGICKFIGIYLEQSTKLICDEDLLIKNLNLDFFSCIEVGDIVDMLNESINWIEINVQGNYEKEMLKNYLRLVICLNKLISITDMKTNFLSNEVCVKQYDFCDMGIKCVQNLNEIKKNNNFVETIPNGAFSKFIQSDYDNNDITMELKAASENESFKILFNLFDFVNDFMIKVEKIKNCNQFLKFLKFDIASDNKKIDSISKYLFKICFIGNSEYIFRSLNFNLTKIIFLLVENLLGPDVEILLLEFHLNNLNINESEKSIFQKKLFHLYNHLELCIHNVFLIYGNNLCQKNHLFLKNINSWKYLQMECFLFETQLYDNFKLGGISSMNKSSFSLSSFIHYTKYELLVDIILSGFTLDLYDSFEFYLVYWFSEHLVKMRICYLNHIINQIINNKISTLKTNLKKNKTLDPIENTNLHSLINCKKFNSEYRLISLTGILNLINGIRFYLLTLSTIGFFDFFQSPEKSFVPFENLFFLRLKTWTKIKQSFFNDYKDSLNLNYFKNKTKRKSRIKKLLFSIIEKLESSTQFHQKILETFKYDEFMMSQILTDNITNIEKWYNDLINTSTFYINETKKLLKLSSIVDFDELKNNYYLNTKKGYHRYFLKIFITKNE